MALSVPATLDAVGSACRRNRPMKSNLIIDKGMIPAGKERIDRVDQRRRGTPVPFQRIPGAHLTGGLHIRKYIGSPKAVDRLFRIADEKQGLVTRPEYPVEDFILNRVGILKLIDQRRSELSPDRVGQ